MKLAAVRGAMATARRAATAPAATSATPRRLKEDGMGLGGSTLSTVRVLVLVLEAVTGWKYTRSPAARGEEELTGARGRVGGVSYQRARTASTYFVNTRVAAAARGRYYDRLPR